MTQMKAGAIDLFLSQHYHAGIVLTVEFAQLLKPIKIDLLIKEKVDITVRFLPVDYIQIFLYSLYMK